MHSSCKAASPTTPWAVQWLMSGLRIFVPPALNTVHGSMAWGWTSMNTWHRSTNKVDPFHTNGTPSSIQFNHQIAQLNITWYILEFSCPYIVCLKIWVQIIFPERGLYFIQGESISMAQDMRNKDQMSLKVMTSYNILLDILI